MFRTVIAIAVALCFTSNGWAQASCSDVLKGGTFSTYTKAGRRQLETASYLNIASSNASSQANSSAMGVSVPLEDLPIHLSYSQSKSSAMRAALNRTEFSYLLNYNDYEVALVSGDPTIVGAWSSCMAGQVGGVIAYFTTDSPTDVNLRIEYHVQAGIDNPNTSAKLTSDLYIPPDFKILQNGYCLKSGYTITGGGCTIIMKAPDARASFSTSIQTDINSLKARLAPRITLQRQSASLASMMEDAGTPLAPIVFSVPEARNATKTSPRLILSKDLRDKGWVIDPDSVTVLPGTNSLRLIKCFSAKPTVAPTDLIFSAYVDSNEPKRTGTCTYSWGAIQVFRFALVGDDAVLVDSGK